MEEILEKDAIELSLEIAEHGFGHYIKNKGNVPRTYSYYSLIKEEIINSNQILSSPTFSLKFMNAIALQEAIELNSLFPNKVDNKCFAFIAAITMVYIENNRQEELEDIMELTYWSFTKSVYKQNLFGEDKTSLIPRLLAYQENLSSTIEKLQLKQQQAQNKKLIKTTN